MDIKGSKTEKNLLAAFAGESQAFTKYSYFASQAKKDGFEQISGIFTETAHNEKEHAKLWFKLLGGIGDTMTNLKSAADGELEEHSDMYPTFAKEAREEGFDSIAALFERVAAIEESHEARYRTLLENINNGSVFKRGEKQFWFCRNCGHIHYSETAPEVCPTCAHPKSYFEIRSTNY